MALSPWPALARAQELGKQLRHFGTANARLYASPAISGVAAALNSGFHHTARVHEPLGFDVGIRAMGAFMPSSDRTFVPVVPKVVQFEGRTYRSPYAPAPGTRRKSPTAIGQGDGALLVPQGEFRQALLEAGMDPRAYDVRLPEGFDYPAIPMAVAQVGVGLPGGSEVVFRFLPEVELHDEVGSLSIRGVGVKHSIDQWLPRPLPVSLSIAFGWQRLGIGRHLKARARNVSLVTSRDVGGLLTLYAAGTLEDTDVDVAYTVEGTADIPGLPPAGATILWTQDTANSTRLTLGSTFNLLFLKLNADYSFSAYRVLSVNLLVSHR